jgi:hypothetical protein
VNEGRDRERGTKPCANPAKGVEVADVIALVKNSVVARAKHVWKDQAGEDLYPISRMGLLDESFASLLEQSHVRFVRQEKMVLVERAVF